MKLKEVWEAAKKDGLDTVHFPNTTAPPAGRCKVATAAGTDTRKARASRSAGV
jgi:hypothetical protein